MEKQISVVKYENNILPGFRNKINLAESSEDVKNFFIQAIRELLVNLFQDNGYQDFDAIKLSPEKEPFFELNNAMVTSGEFSQMWKNSDLRHVIRRMAETAAHRHGHLKKKPAKTERKIRN